MSTFSELIDFTRSSTGTYLDSVVYGDELVTNGTFDTDSDWDKEPEWTIANGVATFDDVNNANLQQPNMGLVVGKSYLFSFEITSGATPNFSLFASGSSDQYTGYETYPVGSHQVVFTCTGGDGIRIAASRFLGSAFSIDNVSVKEIIGGQGTAGTPLLRTADTNEPRLEYNASGQPLGLLIEEQRTNLVSNSVNANSDNATTNVTQTANQANSLTSTNDAFLLQADTTGTSYSGQTTSVTSGTSYTASRFAKAGASNFAQLSMGTSGFGNQVFANFDLNTGTVAQESNCVAVIANVGSGWYRCSISAQAVSTTSASTPHYFSAVNSGTALIRTSEAGNSVYFYGSQTEVGSFPTSYIPTSGSTVTRNADIPSLPIERFSYNDTQGTLFAEFEHNAVNSSASFLVSDNTLNNRIQLTSRQTGTSGATAFISASGTTQTAFSTSYNFIAGNKSTLAYKLNDCATTMNGYSVNADTSVTIPTVTTVYIGNINSGAKINGHVKRIQYFPKRLSNDELVELTKPSSSPTMSLTFDGQATSELVEGLHD